MNKIEEIEQYINDFFESRIENINMFYRDVSTNKRVGIYNLNEGNGLMDFLNSIHGNIEEKLTGELIPEKFATIDVLISALKAFKKYLNKNQYLLDLNPDNSYIIPEIQHIKNELIQLIDYIVNVYDIDDDVIPIIRLKKSLVSKDIDSFFLTIKSLLASISYPILKDKEGYLHSNIHLMLKLLGFDIISEENTNVARIDAVIRFSNLIYIIEFKLGSSQEAIDQIKKNKYHEKFVHEGKEIIIVGVGFNNKNRNIEDYISEII